MDGKLTIESLAEELYETYCESVGGKSVSGEPLPNWNVLQKDPDKAKIVNAWIGVAWKARHAVTVKISAGLMDSLSQFPS